MPETRKPGRPKGAINKVTADVKAKAQVYTARALKALVKIMDHGESEAAIVAAANAILDRGHGKPKQAIDVDGDIRHAVSIVERKIVRPQASHPDS